MNEFRQFDAILHLAGEQPLPLYIGLRQFDCNRHILACTDKTAFVASVMRKVLPETVQIESLAVPPYDIAGAEKAIRNRLSEGPDGKWALNLTGGTKPMFAAAWRAANPDMPAFYVETMNQSLYWLRGGGRKEALRPCIERIDDFVALAGYESNRAFADAVAERSSARAAVAMTCYQMRSAIAACHRDPRLASYADHPGLPFSRMTFGESVVLELKGPESESQGFLKLGRHEFRKRNWQDIASFVRGGWLEEFIWNCAQRLREQDRVKDLALRLCPLPPAGSSATEPVQEFDVSFTDGYLLTIIECKAGEVRQEAIQKLENITRTFGGHFGRGIIVYAQPRKIGPETEERIRASRNVAAIAADEIVRNPACLLKAQSGEILGKCGGRRFNR